ncbi:PPM-type phosphatase domain [Trypanosoma melophagium]|uniref:PPM-type phosphatase domain n=1 Tax=Trypanosoma melophagium TaxID=715481 RepID=UPI003519F027|nr:PPM-type phosphatase domain [Trypanosoma melophagium]
MPVARRARSCTFWYKNIEEARKSAVLQKAHRQVDFENTIITPSPVLGVTVVGQCQGWRRYMEDRSCALKTEENGVLVIVLDGHRGEQAAEFCANTLPQAILDNVKRGVQNEQVNCVNTGSVSSGSVGISNSNTSRSNNNNYSEHSTTHALEIFSEDPNFVTRRDAFVRAFAETDAQLFDLQGGTNVYYAEPRESSSPTAPGVNSLIMSKKDDNENEALNGTYDILDPLDLPQLVDMSQKSSSKDTNNTSANDNSMNATVSSVAGSTKQRPPPSSGATAVAILVDATHITVSNLGDCRAFIIERRANTSTSTTTPSSPFFTTSSLSSSFFSSSPSSPALLGEDAGHVSLPPGVFVRNAAAAHRPTQHRREAKRLERQFGPRVLVNGRVLGTLMVTRAFGDFDVKFGMAASVDAALPENFYVSPTAVRNPHRRPPPTSNNNNNESYIHTVDGASPDAHYRYHYHDDINNISGYNNNDYDYDAEMWESPLLVSNVPHTRVWRRAQLPRPPPGGWSSTDIIPYDLIVAGSDGTWESHGATVLASRADAALQPLLQEWHQRFHNNSQKRGLLGEGGEKKEQAEFTAAIEATLKNIVTETLRAGISLFCTQHAAVPGGDNMSLALVLLL